MAETDPEFRDPKADEVALRSILDRLAAMPVEDVEIPPSHDETPEQARERVRLAAQSKATRWRSRLPVDFGEATLDELDPAVREIVERWLVDPNGRNLVLVGNVGAGKTHTAYAIGNHVLDRAGLWVEASSVYNLMKSMQPDGDPYAYDRACRCDLLVLDDLVASKATEWAVSTLTAIMDARVGSRLRTVVTTNLDEPTLRAIWGERLVDRLRMGLAVVRFVGGSRRQAAF